MSELNNITMYCKDCFYFELCKSTRCGNLHTNNCDFYTSRAEVYAGNIPIDEVIPV